MTSWGARAAAALIVAGSSLLVVQSKPTGAVGEERTLSIYNIHTKETVTATYKRNGRFIEDGLDQIDHAMRDWRTDTVIEIDRGLVDLLWELHAELGSEEPIHLISGHRSQKTNNMLRRTRGGQARRSQHITGRAADVYFPDIPLKKLRNAALIRERGGVGYYPRSGQPFVHVDTGRVRHWPRIPAKQLAAIKRNKNPNRGVDPVPVTRVATVAVDVPGPRSKPGVAQATPPKIEQPDIVRFAGVVLRAGESVEQPTRRPLPVRTASVTPAPRWGQSYLTPSGASVAPPRSAPLSSEGGVLPALRGLENTVVDGVTRLASAFDSSPTPNTASAKIDTPRGAEIATGYAPRVAEQRRDPLIGLLDNPAGDLPSLIAEAQLLQDRLPRPAPQAVPGTPLDLRPAVLATPAPQPAATAAPAPVVTASLTPDHATGTRKESGVAQSLVVAHVPPPAPRDNTILQTDAALFSSLLRAPAAQHGLTFEPVRVASVTIDSFTLSEYGLLGPHPLNKTAATAPADDGIVAVARQLIDWIFGS